MNMFTNGDGAPSATSLGKLATALLLVFLLAGCDKAKEALEKAKEKTSELAKSAKEQIDKANIKPLDRTSGDGMANAEGEEENVVAAPLDPAIAARALIDLFANPAPHSKSDEKFRNLASLDPSYLAQVVTLELQGTGISNEALAEVGKFPNLKSLNIASCRQINGPGFATIGQCTALETLLAQNSGFDDAAFQAIAPLAHLKHLNVSLCNVTDTGMAVVPGLIELETISLEGCKGITGKTFAKGPCPPRLIEFRANESNFGMQGAPGLKGGNLQIVQLRGSGLDDKQAPKLYTIKSLKELWLNSNNLTDNGIKGVAALKDIEILYLNGTQLKGKEMGFLRQMKSLKELHIEYLQVSPAQQQELTKALPDAKISF